MEVSGELSITRVLPVAFLLGLVLALPECVDPGDDGELVLFEQAATPAASRAVAARAMKRL
jgi:hypothetical protein